MTILTTKTYETTLDNGVVKTLTVHTHDDVRSDSFYSKKTKQYGDDFHAVYKYWQMGSDHKYKTSQGVIRSWRASAAGFGNNTVMHIATHTVPRINGNRDKQLIVKVEQ
jgi:hypothetical protein